MKAIILFLFFGLTLSYNPSNALYYASQHCSASSYNPSYNNYKGRGGDCANFVSQCLMAGGLDISNCYGRDDKGSITSVGNLKSCLTQKGWRSSSIKPANFQAGYVLFLKNGEHPLLASYVSGNSIRVYAHTNDRCDENVGSNFDYYYPS